MHRTICQYGRMLFREIRATNDGSEPKLQLLGDAANVGHEDQIIGHFKLFRPIL
ncbi:hypothetical protein CLV80_11518 [Yoonia maritima]|uniref:Uncharacterized protein n=1 Tax=Yoonia maritima TaxID=1435347 RepID=A0A2T0VTY6_9RHOB|nr:hypothetical protein CLV80_11518 [Yoonia maritima]